VPARFLTVADQALEDIFTLQDVTAKQPRLAAGGFDWAWRGPNDDIEWTWFFNRMLWIPDLWKAYKKYGDARYVNCIVVTLDDWIVANPVPQSLFISAAWRPLEVARRLLRVFVPHLSAWEADPNFSDAHIERLKASIFEHGFYLRHHHAKGGNHLITEMLALLTLSYALKLNSICLEWKKFALDQLQRAYQEQVYPDGAHKELSAHYHRIVTQNFSALLHLLDEHGAQKENLVWRPRVERMWRYIASMNKPNGFAPLNNDSDLEPFARLLRQQAPKAIKKQRQTSIYHPWSGHVIFRGRARPHWSFLDLGARGTDHQHADFMSLQMSIGQADFLVDAGRYTYKPGVWRDYFVGAQSHNGILLNQYACDQGPEEYSEMPSNRVEITEAYCSAFCQAIIYDTEGHRIGEWKRGLRYHADQSWIVDDEIIAFGANQLTTYWHWHPSCTFAGDLSDPKGLIVGCEKEKIRLSLKTSGGCELTNLDFVQGIEGPEPQGWYSERFNRRVPAPVSVCTQKIRGCVRNQWIFYDLNARVENQ
jgi:hypothetical protein